MPNDAGIGKAPTSTPRSAACSSRRPPPGRRSSLYRTCTVPRRVTSRQTLTGRACAGCARSGTAVCRATCPQQVQPRVADSRRRHRVHPPPRSGARSSKRTHPSGSRLPVSRVLCPARDRHAAADRRSRAGSGSLRRCRQPSQVSRRQNAPTADGQAAASAHQPNSDRQPARQRNSDHAGLVVLSHAPRPAGCGRCAQRGASAC